jgi:hypothetical protein
MQRHDVRMLELRRELDLATEAFAVHAGREFRRQDLHHHLPVQRLLRSDEHPAHATARELALEDVIVAEGGSKFRLEAVEAGHWQPKRARGGSGRLILRAVKRVGQALLPVVWTAYDVSQRLVP